MHKFVLQFELVLVLPRGSARFSSTMSIPEAPIIKWKVVTHEHDKFHAGRLDANRYLVGHYGGLRT